MLLRCFRVILMWSRSPGMRVFVQCVHFYVQGVCMYVCVCVCVRAYVYTYTHELNDVCKTFLGLFNVQIFMYKVCVYVCVCVCVYLCMYIHIRITYIYMYACIK